MMGANEANVTQFAAVKNADILVTGHTGFTGSWVCHVLSQLGAHVHGLALPPHTTPSMFSLTSVKPLLKSETLGDIGDETQVYETVQRVRPRAILHLAAQPLVLKSYVDPIETFRTNALGTVHVLEAARKTLSVEGIVAITTDKVYANDGHGQNFPESAPLGGSDPYSASKAAAEMAILGYRSSLPSWKRPMVIDVARGGNIIGGGDWSENRLIPDYARAVQTRMPLTIRNPNATRPWQHVLCLVHGYLVLLDRILSGATAASDLPFGEAWNFGPTLEECVPVHTILEKLATHWSPVEIIAETPGVYEAARLAIDSDKVRQILKWKPALSLHDALEYSARWYQAAQNNPERLGVLTHDQINNYLAKL